MTKRDLALLILLTVALHLPFVGEAFHLDDDQYLDIAQNVYRNPGFPLDMPAVFEGKHVSFWGHSHPPLNGYIIAGLLLLHSRVPSEVYLHTAFLVFPVLATVSFYFLARRFTGHAFIASALLATNPTLMVCAHTLMADVPLLSLWLCSTVLFICGIDLDKKRLIYAAGFVMTCACFYAYQGLALIPLLAVYAWIRRRLRVREVAVLCVPILAMAAWQVSGYLYRGVTYIGLMYWYLGGRGIWEGSTRIRTVIATLTYLGGTILPFPFIFWKMGRQWKGALSWTALATAIVVSCARLDGYPLLERVFFTGCFGGGTVVVVWTLMRALSSLSIKKWVTDDMFLTVWFLGMLVGCVVAFYSGSARYLLPAVPPLLLLLIRTDEQRIKAPRWPRGYYGILFTIQLVLGLCLAHSDYEFAGTGRREAMDFESQYLQHRQPFLFSGEWGFRHYMTGRGGQIMAEETTGSPRTLVVKSRLALGKTFDSDFNRSLELIDRKTYHIRSPFRLLDEHSHAAFWSDGWGVLPFWFSREALDELSIYRVKGEGAVPAR